MKLQTILFLVLIILSCTEPKKHSCDIKIKPIKVNKGEVEQYNDLYVLCDIYFLYKDYEKMSNYMYPSFLADGLSGFTERSKGLINFATDSLHYFDYFDGSIEDIMMGDRQWIYDGYGDIDKLSIYIIESTEDDYINGFVQGYGQFHIDDDLLCAREHWQLIDYNSIFITSDALENTKTLGHEIGHWLLLKHCGGEDEYCYRNAMNKSYSYCDVSFSWEQIDTMANALKYRSCCIYGKDELPEKAWYID